MHGRTDVRTHTRRIEQNNNNSNNKNSDNKKTWQLAGGCSVHVSKLPSSGTDITVRDFIHQLLNLEAK